MSRKHRTVSAEWWRCSINQASKWCLGKFSGFSWLLFLIFLVKFISVFHGRSSVFELNVTFRRMDNTGAISRFCEKGYFVTFLRNLQQTIWRFCEEGTAKHVTFSELQKNRYYFTICENGEKYKRTVTSCNFSKKVYQNRYYFVVFEESYNNTGAIRVIGGMIVWKR